MTKMITVVCTGKGAHREVEIGVLYDEREPFEADPYIKLCDMLWPDNRDEHRADADRWLALPRGIWYQRSHSLLQKSGRFRRIERKSTVLRVRADGGRTFDFTCPYCRSKAGRPRLVPLREESISRQFDAGVSRFDISHH